MKKNVTYTWEPHDESRSFAEHAANLLANFHPAPDEKDAPPGLKAFRRVVENGCDFTTDDVELTAQYLEMLGHRAMDRISSLGKYMAGPKCTVEEAELGKAFLEPLQRGADNAFNAANRLRALFVNANAR